MLYHITKLQTHLAAQAFGQFGHQTESYVL